MAQWRLEAPGPGSFYTARHTGSITSSVARGATGDILRREGGRAIIRRERPTLSVASGLVLALLGPPALAAATRRWGGRQPSLTVQLVGQVALSAIAVAVLFILVRWQRLPLRMIGIRRPDAWTPVVAFVVVLVSRSILPALSGWLMRRLALGKFETCIVSLVAQPTWWHVCVALTSGPIEELLYRGYAVE